MQLVKKSSFFNSVARNFKRKISAVEKIPHRRMGRKFDTVYSNCSFDRGFKLPHVMEDMILTIIQNNPTKLNKAHVVGYNINGSSFQLMNMDFPQGYVKRIHRLNQLEYLSDKYDFVNRLRPLIEAAYIGGCIIEEYLKGIGEIKFLLSETYADPILLPPNLI
ncbi:hypothetical protein BDB01DRAFT_794494 [Pilobolus umbonatus]|nr:hypothetical protein BDB01DRAFT_794494 [Pilobolus umbonatus]